MKNKILALSLLIGTATFSTELFAAEIPAALETKLNSIKASAEPVVIPQAVQQYINEAKKAAQGYSSDTKSNLTELGKLMDEKGCDPTIAAVIYTKGDKINDDLKTDVNNMNTALADLESALSKLSQAEEIAETHQSQVQATITFVKEAPTSVSSELPCLCKKTVAEITKEDKVELTKVTGWIDKKAGSATEFVLKNNEYPNGIAINKNVGVWGSGAAAIPSYTPQKHSEEAWIDPNLEQVVCLEHKGPS